MIALLPRPERGANFPAGTWLLVRCNDDDDWSLWRSTPKTDTLRIGWDGKVGRQVMQKFWPNEGRFTFYNVSRDVVDRCLMAASLLDTRGWWAFAKDLTVKEIDRC